MRIAFQFFPLFAIFAFTAVEFIKSEAPFVILLSVTYITASLQKLTHLDDMLIRLPYQMKSMAPPEWIDLAGAEGVLKLTQAMASVVVPYEFLMGSLFLFSQTRALGFAMALFFHFSIAATAGGALILTSVSMELLNVHAANLSYTFNVRISEFVRRHSKFVLAAVALVLFDVGSQFSNQSGVWVIVLRLMCRVGLLILIALYFYSQRPKFINLFNANLWRGRNGKILTLFTAVVIMWSLSAKLYDYKSEHLGWAMFSGAVRTKPVHCFMVQPVDCAIYLRLYPAITFLSYEQQNQYMGNEVSSLQKLRNRIVEKCPQAQPTEIQMHDPAAAKFCRDPHLIF